MIYGYFFCPVCKGFKKVDFDYLEDYQHYIANLEKLEDTVTPLQIEQSRRTRKELGLPDQKMAKPKKKMASKKKPISESATTGPCPIHPKYGGQRKPRSGCHDCMAFYKSKKDIS